MAHLRDHVKAFLHLHAITLIPFLGAGISSDDITPCDKSPSNQLISNTRVRLSFKGLDQA